LDNISVVPLFAIPLYVNNITLTESEIDFIKSQPLIIMDNKSASYTKNKKLLHEEKLNRLKEEVLQHVHNYAKEVYKIDLSRIEFYITTSWCNKFTKGDYGLPHRHRNSIFSGVFYIDTTEDCGELVLQSHCEMRPSPAFEFDFTEWNIFNSASWAIPPKANTIVMFPSLLSHYINANNTETERYSVAFNIFFKGIISHKEEELIL